MGHRPMAFGWHKQSAGTVCVGPQLAKPARAIRETRLALVASKPAQAGSEPRRSLPSGAEPGHKQSSGLLVPGEGLGHAAQRGLQGRPPHASIEGPSAEGLSRAHSRLAKPAAGRRVHQ